MVNPTLAEHGTASALSLRCTACIVRACFDLYCYISCPCFHITADMTVPSLLTGMIYVLSRSLELFHHK